MTQASKDSALAVRAGGLIVALPVAAVLEVMRPLSVQAVAEAPPFVRGLARIRGEVTPVVDLACLLGVVTSGDRRRFVTVQTGAHVVAIAVDEVIGLITVPERAFSPRPTLLGEACLAVAGLATLDADLFALVNTALLIPPALRAALGLPETEA